MRSSGILYRLALTLVSVLALAAFASAAEQPGDSGDWRFDRGMGWRYEVKSGYWSPHYVWWWIDGRAVLGADPVEHSVRHDNGVYELRGDGIDTPFHWVWEAPPAPPPPAQTALAPSDAPRPPPAPRRAPPREYTPTQTYSPAPDYVRVERRRAEQASARAARSNDKTVGGTIIGGATGGLLGAVVTRGRDRFAGVLIGTLIGGLIGHNVGKNLDDADELRAVSALEKNRTGQSSTWINPDSGAEVTMIPQRTFENREGEHCREYETEVVIGGEVEKAYGTACRQPDGQWKVVK